MKWNIFSRLMTGYLALLALATGLGVYAIVQLRHVRDVTDSVILVDNPLLDLHKNMSDALFSEQRFEKKYIIMRDEVLYRGFAASNAEFERHLAAARRLAGAEELQATLTRAAEFHRVYEALFKKEVWYLRSGRHYPESWYRSEKEKAVGGLTDELTRVRTLSQQNMLDKVKELREAGKRATRVAITTSAVSAGLGIILSLLITRSITRPLQVMKKKMAGIRSGVLKDRLNIASPPEIAELGRSFNLMCDKLNELDRLKDDFYALMSHELRTPLSSIKESTNLILEGTGGDVTEMQKRLLSITAEESNRLIGLVNSLLDISKLEAGMLSYNFNRADLNQLIMKAAREMEPLAIAKQISIRRELAQLPQFSMDAERMLQVLRNLIGNALKFTPEGGVITISSLCSEKGICVSVSDTGPGIPGRDAPIIFDRYRQASAAGPHKIQGTGLGLAIVKHIIHDHGGTVWVESATGSGSTFVFVLPPRS